MDYLEFFVEDVPLHLLIHLSVWTSGYQLLVYFAPSVPSLDINPFVPLAYPICLLGVTSRCLELFLHMPPLPAPPPRISHSYEEPRLPCWKMWSGSRVCSYFYWYIWPLVPLLVGILCLSGDLPSCPTILELPPVPTVSSEASLDSLTVQWNASEPSTFIFMSDQ